MKRQRPGLPPLSVRVAVAQHQYFASLPPLLQDIGWPKVMVEWAVTMSLEQRLAKVLRMLFGEQKLHLDHDPALRLRKYNPRIKNVAARYTPHAHDQRFLLYRPVAPEADRSHHIKTYVRGEHGQHSDTVLIKRERRRERASKKPAKVRAPKWKRGTKLRSANRWPPKGSQSFRRKT